MEDGTLGDELNPWATELFDTLQGVDPQTPSQQATYGKWLDERFAREEARNDRIHGAAGVIPLPLWLVLFFITGVIFVFVLFFADRAERAIVQALLMGSVMSVIVSMLLLLQFLNNPFHAGVGGLRPVAMERTLRIADQEVDLAALGVDGRCDASGNML